MRSTSIFWEEAREIMLQDTQRYERAINPDLLMTGEVFWAVVSEQYFGTLKLLDRE